jgi:glyoxylase-like metal-dependent hydrolase (beta-lactamase superfamily II)
MAIRVRHLKCGTLRLPDAPMVCHVLLLKTESGLGLVESGFGLADIADPARRVGPFRHVIRPLLNPEETAIRQVEQLGFRTGDVHHFLLTHLDIDHIGGLSDFPRAQVHLNSAEAQGAIRHPSFTERQRCNGPTARQSSSTRRETPSGAASRGESACQHRTPPPDGAASRPYERPSRLRNRHR